MSLEDITDQIRQKLQYAGNLKACVKFDFGDEGLIFVDSNQSPPLITHEDSEADVTLSSSLATFEKILAGAQDANVAFMMGKLKVRGSMGLAMKLNGILSD